MQQIGRLFIPIILVFAVPLVCGSRALAQESEKKAVENVVRGFEQAVQDYDFDRCNALLMPDAEWIGAVPNLPGPAPATQGLEEFRRYQAAKSALMNRPYNVDVRVHGDVAWVTLLVDVTITFDNDTARAFVHARPDERQRVVSYAESEVLLKTPQGWRIVLGHSSTVNQAK